MLYTLFQCQGEIVNEPLLIINNYLVRILCLQLRLITLTKTLTTLDITKTESNTVIVLLYKVALT